MVRIASFNVENLFARPKAFAPSDWTQSEPAINAYHKVNRLFAKPNYSTPGQNRNLATSIGVRYLQQKFQWRDPAQVFKIT